MLGCSSHTSQSSIYLVMVMWWAFSPASFCWQEQDTLEQAEWLCALTFMPMIEMMSVATDNMCYFLIGFAWPWRSVLTCQSLCCKEIGLWQMCQSLWLLEVLDDWPSILVGLYFAFIMKQHYTTVFLIFVSFT